jgi:hypothetical protein
MSPSSRRASSSPRLLHIPLIVFLILSLQPALPAHAATFDIACNDVPALIAAITTANGNGVPDTINLASSCTYTLTAIDNGSEGNANGLPVITSQITIDGDLTTIARSSAGGTPEFRILQVNPGGNLELFGTTITNGLADEGGGIYNAGTLLLNNVSVYDNAVVASQSKGGGIYNSGTLTLLGTRVESNSATSMWSYGGGLCNDGGTVTVESSFFGYNSASSASEARGGGIYSQGGSLTLEDVNFLMNTTGGNFTASGGGLYLSGGTAALTGVHFDRNDAAFNEGQGGGMVIKGGATVSVEDAQFIDNSAGYGGGMYVESSEPTVMNTTFLGNHVNWEGGGMMIEFSLNPKLTNVVFSGNAAVRGGGLAHRFSLPTLTNLTLSGNSASTYGGGMYGGICWNLTHGSEPIVRNSIFWHNTAGLGTLAEKQIDNHACEYNVPIISYTLIEGAFEGGLWNSALGTDEGHNLDADPRFADGDGTDGTYGTEDDNLRLGSGSPAADAGSNALVPADTLDLDEDANTTEPVPLDLAYKARFIDAPEVPNTGSGTPPIVDMGAYERLAHILLPLILRNF